MMAAFWLIVVGIALVVGSLLYWASTPSIGSMEFWWVIPRVVDYVVARRYMRMAFGVLPPLAVPLHGFTWAGPFPQEDAEKLPPGALWLVQIKRE